MGNVDMGMTCVKQVLSRASSFKMDTPKTNVDASNTSLEASANSVKGPGTVVEVTGIAVEASHSRLETANNRLEATGSSMEIGCSIVAAESTSLEATNHSSEHINNGLEATCSSLEAINKSIETANGSMEIAENSVKDKDEGSCMEVIGGTEETTGNNVKVIESNMEATNSTVSAATSNMKATDDDAEITNSNLGATDCSVEAKDSCMEAADSSTKAIGSSVEDTDIKVASTSGSVEYTVSCMGTNNSNVPSECNSIESLDTTAVSNIAGDETSNNIALQDSDTELVHTNAEATNLSGNTGINGTSNESNTSSSGDRIEELSSQDEDNTENSISNGAAVEHNSGTDNIPPVDADSTSVDNVNKADIKENGNVVEEDAAAKGDEGAEDENFLWLQEISNRSEYKRVMAPEHLLLSLQAAAPLKKDQVRLALQHLTRFYPWLRLGIEQRTKEELEADNQKQDDKQCKKQTDAQTSPSAERQESDDGALIVVDLIQFDENISGAERQNEEAVDDGRPVIPADDNAVSEEQEVGDAPEDNHDDNGRNDTNGHNVSQVSESHDTDDRGAVGQDVIAEEGKGEGDSGRRKQSKRVNQDGENDTESDDNYESATSATESEDNYDTATESQDKENAKENIENERSPGDTGDNARNKDDETNAAKTKNDDDEDDDYDEDEDEDEDEEEEETRHFNQRRRREKIAWLCYFPEKKLDFEVLDRETSEWDMMDMMESAQYRHTGLCVGPFCRFKLMKGPFTVKENNNTSTSSTNNNTSASSTTTESTVTTTDTSNNSIEACDSVSDNLVSSRQSTLAHSDSTAVPNTSVVSCSPDLPSSMNTTTSCGMMSTCENSSTTFMISCATNTFSSSTVSTPGIMNTKSDTIVSVANTDVIPTGNIVDLGSHIDSTQTIETDNSATSVRMDSNANSDIPSRHSIRTTSSASTIPLHTVTTTNSSNSYSTSVSFTNTSLTVTNTVSTNPIISTVTTSVAPGFNDCVNGHPVSTKSTPTLSTNITPITTTTNLSPSVSTCTTSCENIPPNPLTSSDTITTTTSPTTCVSFVPSNNSVLPHKYQLLLCAPGPLLNRDTKDDFWMTFIRLLNDVIVKQPTNEVALELSEKDSIVLNQEHILEKGSECIKRSTDGSVKKSETSSDDVIAGMGSQSEIPNENTDSGSDCSSVDENRTTNVTSESESDGVEDMKRNKSLTDKRAELMSHLEYIHKLMNERIVIDVNHNLISGGFNGEENDDDENGYVSKSLGSLLTKNFFNRCKAERVCYSSAFMVCVNIAAGNFLMRAGLENGSQEVQLKSRIRMYYNWPQPLDDWRDTHNDVDEDENDNGDEDEDEDDDDDRTANDNITITVMPKDWKVHFWSMVKSINVQRWNMPSGRVRREKVRILLPSEIETEDEDPEERQYPNTSISIPSINSKDWRPCFTNGDHVISTGIQKLSPLIHFLTNSNINLNVIAGAPSLHFSVGHPTLFLPAATGRLFAEEIVSVIKRCLT